MNLQTINILIWSYCGQYSLSKRPLILWVTVCPKKPLNTSVCSSRGYNFYSHKKYVFLTRNFNPCNGRLCMNKGFLFATSNWNFLKAMLRKSNSIASFAMTMTYRKEKYSLKTIIQSE